LRFRWYEPLCEFDENTIRRLFEETSKLVSTTTEDLFVILTKPLDRFGDITDLETYVMDSLAMQAEVVEHGAGSDWLDELQQCCPTVDVRGAWQQVRDFRTGNCDVLLVLTHPSKIVRVPPDRGRQIRDNDTHVINSRIQMNSLVGYQGCEPRRQRHIPSRFGSTTLVFLFHYMTRRQLPDSSEDSLILLTNPSRQFSNLGKQQRQ